MDNLDAKAIENNEGLSCEVVLEMTLMGCIIRSCDYELVKRVFLTSERKLSRKFVEGILSH
ncbi:hypothetical protein HPP92_027985 [Vanilla planifolia]|uniref:Uncharacterized protein n=1 Tax=Vanilla planifolia TaxID=51239 RepID=A0A835P943_VANPL|nr:hypothetical protein HPP92_027985 [Vanilla planifolia]